MTTRSLLCQVPVLAMVWVCVLAGVSLLSDAAPAQVVLLPETRLLENLPEDVAIVSYSGWSATLVSDEPTFARRLYASGAWLVLPGQLKGCVALTRG